jgi:AcrR family transcriptional regulator
MPARRQRRIGSVVATRMPAADRRVHLLEAAREVICADGLSMLSMERVALHARVSKPVLYSHFQNRGALVIALMEDYWTSIDDMLKTSTKASTSLDEFSEILIESYFAALGRGGPALQALLSSGSDEPELIAARQERFRRVERIWSRQYQRALGLPPSVADIAASVLRSAVAGAGDYWMASPTKDPAQCMMVCLAVVKGALKELEAQRSTARKGTSNRGAAAATATRRARA